MSHPELQSDSPARTVEEVRRPLPARSPRVPDTAGPWGWLDEPLRRIGELGLSCAVFDAEGRMVSRPCGGGPIAALLLPADPVGPCGPVADALGVVRGDGTAGGRDCLPGSVCLLVPIQRRRRRLGVVALCCLCRDLPDDEELARFCQRRGVDRELLLRLVRQQACFDRDQLPVVRSMVAMLVEQALEHHVAREELGALSQNLTNTYEELSLVYHIAAGMTVTEKPGDYLRGIIAELVEVIDVESVAVRYFRPDQPLISEHLSVGAELTSPTVEQAMWDDLLRRFEAKPEEIVNNQAGREAPPRPGAPPAGRNPATRHGPRGPGGVRQLAAVPMVRNGRLVGALLALNKHRGEFDSVDLKLMRSIADEAAVFLENAFLYEDLQQLLMGMLRALTSSIDAKDPYTCGHSERVALIARRIAEAAGLDEYAVGRVYVSGLLHDIGKIGVPESVLTKPGRLTKAEFAVMKKHPEIGARILSGIKQVEDLVPGVLYHHERMDGKGYPEGLHAGQIPLFGRIVGLADCFDAMTSNRTYRRALPLEVTLAEIRRFAGTQFDPRIVEAFFRIDPVELIRQTRSIDPLDPLGSVVRQSGPLLNHA